MILLSSKWSTDQTDKRCACRALTLSFLYRQLIFPFNQSSTQDPEGTLLGNQQR